MSVFQFQTIEVNFDRSSRSVTIYLNQPEKQNAINLDMIGEILGLLNFISSRKEIFSVIFTSKFDFFSSGLDLSELKKGNEYSELLISRLQFLYKSITNLPQHVIFDLRQMALNEALELSKAADQVIADKSGIFKINYLQEDRISPFGILGSKYSMPLVQFWQNYEDLDNTQIENILKDILLQDPFARIQNKELHRQLNELKTGELEQVFLIAAKVMKGMWKLQSTNADTRPLGPNA